VAAQTAEASPWDVDAQAARASCAGFDTSDTLTVTQLTQTSARVSSSSQGSTFWLTDSAGTVIALQTGAGTQATLSWDARAAPAYLVGHSGCTSSGETGLESLPTPSWAQRLSDVQNAWDSRSSTSATGLAPTLTVNYAAKRFSVQASTELGSASTGSVIGEQLVPLVYVRDGVGNVLYVKEYSAADGSGSQPTSPTFDFLPNATLLKACALVGNGNQCEELDLTPSTISELLSESTIVNRANAASYVTSSFSSGLGTLTLTPGPQCSADASYTLFSDTGVLAYSSPLALAVDFSTTTVTVYACCAPLTSTARRGCSAGLSQLSLNVQSLLNAEALALSSLAAAADEAAEAAALAGGSLLCDSTHVVGDVYVRPSSGAECTCQCVQYHSEALANCTLAAPSCIGGTAPPAPPRPPTDSSIGTGGALAITFSALLAVGAIGMVGRQRWIEGARAKAYNVQLGHGSA